MADFEILSLDELTELIVASFANLLPDKAIGRNSDNWKRCRILAGAITDLHRHIQVAERDAWPDTAGERTIGRHGGIRKLPRRAANSASGADAGKVRGENGASWEIDDALVHKSGLRFRPTAGGTLGVSGEALVGIVSIDVGAETRLEAGQTLTWETTPDGLENVVELQADLDQGGADVEVIGEYRTRILNRIAQPAMGGNANDYEQWVLESSANIKAAYPYPNRNGVGTVDVAALKAGRGAARLLDAGERAALAEYLAPRAPVNAEARVIEVVTELADAEILLYPEGAVAYGQDWPDTVPLVVSSWTAATRLLVFTTDRSAAMTPRGRLVIRGTSGIELEIESLSSTNGVVLKDAKGQTPVATWEVYSGGPLITPVRDAILALFDSLGPREGGFGQGNWEGTLRLSKLFGTAQNTPGVLDSVIISPASNLEPTPEVYLNDDHVGLLIPGSILVRYG